MRGFAEIGNRGERPRQRMRGARGKRHTLLVEAEDKPWLCSAYLRDSDGRLAELPLGVTQATRSAEP
jgi:hypothetical protein